MEAEDDASFTAALAAQEEEIFRFVEGLKDIIVPKSPKPAEDACKKHVKDEQDRREMHKKLLTLIHDHSKEVLDDLKAGAFDNFGVVSQHFVEAATCRNKKPIPTKTAQMLCGGLKMIYLWKQLLEERHLRREYQSQLQALIKQHWQC